jgi:hypothetical protein
LRADLFLKHFGRSVESIRTTLGRQKPERRNPRRFGVPEQVLSQFLINAKERPAEWRGQKQLFVDDKPFIMLSGELHNPSASSVEYMRPIWDKLAALHLNTVD